MHMYDALHFSRIELHSSERLNGISPFPVLSASLKPRVWAVSRRSQLVKRPVYCLARRGRTAPPSGRFVSTVNAFVWDSVAERTGTRTEEASETRAPTPAAGAAFADAAPSSPPLYASRTRRRRRIWQRLPGRRGPLSGSFSPDRRGVLERTVAGGTRVVRVGDPMRSAARGHDKKTRLAHGDEGGCHLGTLRLIDDGVAAR